MVKCNITDKELVEALDVTLERLAEICDFFDNDPNDDWELIQGTHFEWGPHKARIFSPEGAVEICHYLESNKQERPIFQRFKRWLFQRDQRLKGLMISRRIQETSTLHGQLVFRGGKAFLAPRACREVLGLGKRQDILNRTFQEIQRPEDGNTDKEPLKPGEDYFEDEQKRKYLYFSGSGIAVVSKHLGVRLTQKHRQDWMQAVAEYAPRALKTIEEHEADREQHITRVMDRVRRQAKGRCQLTNRRKSVHKFNLEVHHLFDKNAYPQFAGKDINLIAIGSDIHAHFHQWMGGTHISCTVEDMERYIEEFSNSLFPNGNAEQATKVAIHLCNVKKELGVIHK